MLLIIKTTLNTQYFFWMYGPIIDPPFNASSEVIEKRCEAFRLCISKGIIVIGIVKRIVGNMFIQYISQCFPEQSNIWEFY